MNTLRAAAAATSAAAGGVAFVSLATLATLANLAPVAPVAAQEATMHQAADFDVSRALLNNQPMFDPFRVEATMPLSRALRERLVEDETPLLVVERGGRTLALLTLQMAYHHVAQGSIAGEPWMVAF